MGRDVDVERWWTVVVADDPRARVVLVSHQGECRPAMIVVEGEHIVIDQGDLEGLLEEPATFERGRVLLQRVFGMLRLRE